MSFVRAACDLIVCDLDWDTVNAAALDFFAVDARMLDGTPVVVAVLDEPDLIDAVRADVDLLRAETVGWASAPLWLYVPDRLIIDKRDAVVRRVPLG